MSHPDHHPGDVWLGLLLFVALVFTLWTFGSGCATASKTLAAADCPACPLATPAPAPIPCPPAVETRVVVHEAAPCPTLTVHFATDSAELSPDAAELLHRAAGCLEGPVRVTGHADERGTGEYNFALGMQRARAVRGFLRSLGLRDVEVRSLGEERPAADWERSRRAVVQRARAPRRPPGST